MNKIFSSLIYQLLKTFIQFSVTNRGSNRGLIEDCKIIITQRHVKRMWHNQPYTGCFRPSVRCRPICTGVNETQNHSDSTVTPIFDSSEIRKISIYVVNNCPKRVLFGLGVRLGTQVCAKIECATSHFKIVSTFKMLTPKVCYFCNSY